jgi:hypothetical protein
VVSSGRVLEEQQLLVLNDLRTLWLIYLEFGCQHQLSVALTQGTRCPPQRHQFGCAITPSACYGAWGVE